ncbi:GAF domain-containing protein [Variovorax sp. M-6]|uniref:GAF domain-containing protein n=1 Tax=Variovorax sp. M-6 TaxID=3233041 RepID=UPI003F9C15F9
MDAELDRVAGFPDSIVAVTADADRLGAISLVERSIGGLLRVVREQLDLEVVFLGEFVKGRRVFRHVAAKEPEAAIKVGEWNLLDETVCKRIVDGRMPKVLESVARVREQYGLPPIFDSMGAHIGVPVRFTDGTLYGVLCGFSSQAHQHLNERDVKRLEMAAASAARLLAQAAGHDVSRSIPPWR